VHQIVALVDEDVRRMMRAMNADIQASLALSRAMLQAVSVLSEQAAEAAEGALAQEIEAARQLEASDRLVAVLEEARASVASGTEADLAAMDALERALQAAAETLPEREARASAGR